MGTTKRILKTPCSNCGGKLEYYYISDCSYNDASGVECTKCGKSFSSEAVAKRALCHTGKVPLPTKAPHPTRTMNWYGDTGTLNTDPGTVRKAVCGVCGTTMPLTKKGVLGPTSFMEAMGRGKGHLHDVFRCPYYAAEWHKRIVDLKHEGQTTKSATIRKLLEKEIRKILKTRKVPQL